MTIQLEEKPALLDQELDEKQDSQNEQALAMAGIQHGIIGTLLGGYLALYVYPNELGAVCDAQTTFRVVGKPPMRQPDVAFIAVAHLPEDLTTQADFAPDLAVEVVSENDKITETEAKVWQYQQSGVRLVWVIHPFSQTVAIYRLLTGLTPQTINVAEELDGEDVIPGFKLSVKNLFPALLKRKASQA